MFSADRIHDSDCGTTVPSHIKNTGRNLYDIKALIRNLLNVCKKYFVPTELQTWLPIIFHDTAICRPYQILYGITTLVANIKIVLPEVTDYSSLPVFQKCPK